MSATLLAFNRGIISRLAAARVDLKRMALSARVMLNWFPRVLGAMMLRPGLAFVGSSKDNLQMRPLDFVFSVSDTALIELTTNAMRVRVSEILVTTPTTDTTIINGDFTTDLTGWTDSDEAGGVSSWSTGGFMSLLGDDTKEARRDQEVTVAVGDRGKIHCLRVEVTKGPLRIKLGSTSGGSEYMSSVLNTGYHFLRITPTANFFIRLAASRKTPAFVSSVTIYTGDLELPTPWTDLEAIRTEQSGDVIFAASENIPQKRIERRSNNSWSIVDYVTEDGPWRIENTDDTIKLTPSALSGVTTLTASKDVFTSANVGSLIKISSVGQYVEATLVAADTYSGYVRITGVGAGRYVWIKVSGTWSGTLTIQRSVGAPGDWSDARTVGNTAGFNRDDGLDNQVVYYRIGFKPGDFTSGSATVSMTYESGTISGVARISGYTSPTVVAVDVISTFGGLTASANWSEGEWSPRRGYPSAVAIHDGRLWWAGSDKIIGSVSDAYNSFDDTLEGDSAPISRSIGSGPVDTISWLMSANNLLVGGQGAEFVCRSSSLDEPLTPTNFNLRTISTLGSASIQAIKIDTSVVFANRNKSRAYEIAYDGQGFKSQDLSSIYPEVGRNSFKCIVVQRQPDTRIHFVRGDGTAAVLIFDKLEEVTCWCELETDGLVEYAVMLPGAVEDTVYYVVARAVGGVTKRFLERFALESQSIGATDTRLADSHIVYSGASTVTIPVAHLEGEEVVVWGNGKDLGTYTVTSGTIALSEAVTWCCVGLYYRARFKSTRLSLIEAPPLAQRQRVNSVGLLLADTHAQGLRYGTTFDVMDDLPLMHQYDMVDVDSVFEDYEAEAIPVPGNWSVGASLCLEAASPRSCTVLAAVVNGTGNMK